MLDADKTEEKVIAVQLQARELQIAQGLAEARQRPGRILPWSLQREHGPANIWILDLCPPELWENQFLLFEAPKSVVICFGSPRKQAQKHRDGREGQAGLQIEAENEKGLFVFIETCWTYNIISVRCTT